MTQRLDYGRLSPEMTRKLFELSMTFKNSPIEPGLKHLVDLRVSQLNGCAFCVDMHTKEAKIGGERELRLHHVTVWRESPLFDERERAALAWAETLTRLPEHGVSDEAYAAVRAVFSEKEVADLSYVIVTINAWNRLSIAFRAVPGSRDQEYGLTKAGLN